VRAPFASLQVEAVNDKEQSCWGHIMKCHLTLGTHIVSPFAGPKVQVEYPLSKNHVGAQKVSDFGAF
jgi:hypothetical protein